MFSKRANKNRIPNYDVDCQFKKKICADIN